MQRSGNEGAQTTIALSFRSLLLLQAPGQSAPADDHVAPPRVIDAIASPYPLLSFPYPLAITAIVAVEDTVTRPTSRVFSPVGHV